MGRQPLTDSAAWFDPAKAEKFEEDTWWNGNNHISRATGSQWDHQVLYRTASKRWVMHWWSQWQGSGETWEEISDSDAATWLLQNNHTHPDAEEAIAAMEI